MLFGIKYPTCVVGDEPEAGLIRMDKYKECENCEGRTDFMDIGLSSYICGDSCRKEMFRKYLRLANGEE